MTEQRNDLHFLERGRADPDTLPVKVRRNRFGEIYAPFHKQQAVDQSQRCLDCGNPYCEWKCPVHNYIPDWLELVAQGRIEEAADLAHETNSLPEICGRICPQDRLCEGACTLQTGFGAVTIGAVEKYLVDTAISRGWRPNLSHVKSLPYHVGIVGAGPAGLACADVLIRGGVKVTVYDRYPEIGGLLSFGIPEFKLEQKVIRRRRTILQDMGIQFALNVDVGVDIPAATLVARHDAIFLGLGASRPVPAQLPGIASAGVVPALDYLIGQTNHAHGYGVPRYPHIDLRGQRVVVLGGGDTAMDCVRTAIRQGARSVTCLYRRNRTNMPGSQREVEHALTEGVTFRFCASPSAILADERGHVTGVGYHETSLAISTATNRAQAKALPGREATMPANCVIIAFGFRPNPPAWLNELAVEVDAGGHVRVATDEYPGQTSNARVFAGGDMVSGADLVVTAIAEGRKAATSILTQLPIMASVLSPSPG